MSEHFGPFDQYKEVMLDGGGVFGIQPGQTLDVGEDGRVVIADAEVVEEEDSTEAAPDPTYEYEAPAEDAVEAEASAEPDAGPSPEEEALIEAQKNPDE